ncbi:outer membrane protein transport protein [Pseudovibrio sp. Tun.PSC04-5.I4]|uniref:OmpP1/FadL family transporter n=1 Tax=Pseudovibrio sp. Tun.PSC04-5.I4 TaxID=1798213 RepID=UPI00087E4AE8|nr:outer membrane protein transport protein [Pseudovibrio sp. Tun.PSC04-5.I4]SDR34577.1 long-chain fatty acid transport protein [Pseudovibrio sp. Tun.PSC04-5.I4]
MRVLKVLARTTVLGCAVSLLPASAFAGGWSTEGIADYDLLFAKEKFAFEGQSTYADRNVDFKNAKTTIGGNPADAVAKNPGKNGAGDIAPNVWLNSGSAKIGLTDNIDFFARINQPYVISEQPGFDWNGKFAIGETNAESLGIDAMLSYKHEVSSGKFLRVFGGVRSVTVDYEQLSNTLIVPPSTAPKYDSTDVSLEVNTDREYGFRLGAAFEMPEIALRALVAYESEIDLNLDGDFGISLPALLGGPISAEASAEASLPQSIEAKVQSGVAPGWLVSLGVKWVDWSVLNKLAVNLTSADVRAPSSVVRDLGYSDGWTVEAGVGHQLTEKLSVGSTLTWDKGIGGPYSDFYALGLGGSYDVTEKVKFSLGGRAIYKTAGEGSYNIARTTGTDVAEVNTDYEYDSSWNFAVSSKIRVAF